MTENEVMLRKMMDSVVLLLGMATSMLFEMDKRMTPDQVRFFQWWKDSMYSVIYEGKPVPLASMPEKWSVTDDT